MKAKVDLSDVQELAAQNLPVSIIARRLGVSRQRVYQICRKNNITTARYHDVVRPRLSRPISRVITGGVAVEINHRVAGCVAEMLVAADLMTRGWAVFMPVLSSRGHDIIAVSGDDILTIEVRSAHRNASGTLVYNRKPDMASAHYALVVTGEPVEYEPPLPG